MNLLNITTKPMMYELSQQRAQLVHKNQRGSLSVKKHGGQMQMRAQNTRVNIDTYERNRSLNLKGIEASSADAVAYAKSAATQAVARYVDMGNQLSKINKDASVGEAYTARAFSDMHRELAFVPISPIEFNWTPAQLERNYTPVELEFQWKPASTNYEFVPSQLSMNILQYPSINFEYLGKPVYAPPSADPEYQLNQTV